MMSKNKLPMIYRFGFADTLERSNLVSLLVYLDNFSYVFVLKKGRTYGRLTFSDKSKHIATCRVNPLKFNNLLELIQNSIVTMDNLKSTLKTEPTDSFNILSPDGIPISVSGFESYAKTLEFYRSWCDRFKAQGYYSSNNGQIPLRQLGVFCTPIKNGESVDAKELMILENLVEAH